MKIEKNKIVFGSILVIIVIFIIAYSALVLGGREEATQELKNPLVPDLELREEDEYSSKLDALDDLEEERERNAPSIYNEKLLDSAGFYDPLLKEKTKRELVDSIYNYGEINYSEGTYREVEGPALEKGLVVDPVMKNPIIEPENFSKAHLEFFEVGPSVLVPSNKTEKADPPIFAAVSGNQKVRANDRLELRLLKDAFINNVLVQKNTLFYGFVSFKPNRLLLEINNIGGEKTALTAYDPLDGNEGVYIKNSFRAKASRQILGDVVEDINVPGIPQIGGIKNLFRRSNQNTRATILNNYKLILKSAL